MRSIGEHRDSVLGVTTSPDGVHVVSASFREHVIVWDRKASKRLGSFGVSSGSVCWLGAMSPDGRTVAAGFGDCTVQLWDGKQRELAKLSGIVASLAWSGDGKRLFTGNCGDNTVRLWDVKSGAVIAEGKTKKSGSWFVALSPDGKRGLSGAGDKLIHVWEAETGREVAAWAGHTGKILNLCFSRDGRRAASASQDRTARIWNPGRGQCVAQLVGHKKQVVGVALSPDGKQAATVSTDRTVRLWDAKSGAELHCFVTEDAPAGVAWAGDEIVVAVGNRVVAFAV